MSVIGGEAMGKRSGSDWEAIGVLGEVVGDIGEAIGDIGKAIGKRGLRPREA